MHEEATSFINDARFRSPLSADDQFIPLQTEEAMFDLHKFVEQAENSALTRALRIERASGTTAEKVWEFLMQKRYRRGSRDIAEQKKGEYLQKIARAEAAAQPLTLTMSFFPNKTRNSLRTFAQHGGEVDMSEMGTILRLYEIAFGLSHLYKSGARFLVTSDGKKYSEAFSDPPEAYETYRTNIQHMIAHLGVEKYVQVQEETEIYAPEYPGILEEIKARITRLFDAKDPALVQEVAKLRPNITLALDIDPRTSIETQALAFNCSLDHLLLHKIAPAASELRESIQTRSIDATLKYIAINKAVYELNTFNRHLPHALKATVHPKLGQLGIYPVNEATNNIFPHNGQGHLRKYSNVLKLDHIRVSFAVDLLRENKRGQLFGIILPSNRYPFSDGKHPFCIGTADE